MTSITDFAEGKPASIPRHTSREGQQSRGQWAQGMEPSWFWSWLYTVGFFISYIHPKGIKSITKLAFWAKTHWKRKPTPLVNPWLLTLLTADQLQILSIKRESEWAAGRKFMRCWFRLITSKGSFSPPFLSWSSLVFLCLFSEIQFLSLFKQ